jgi:hypothetical protein
VLDLQGVGFTWFRVLGLGADASDSGFGGQGLGCWVKGTASASCFGFSVQDSGFKVQD